MKWIIASDLHGSAYYTQLLIKKFYEENAQRMLLLGDILYHGPRNELPKGYAPMEVARMLNEIKQHIVCVRGNCDSEVDQMVLEFPIMADYTIVESGTRLVYATHGHLFNEEKLPPLFKGDILLNGHIHVPKCVDHGDYIYMNPGSVSIPKENTYHGYMTLENGTFIWKDFDGNIKNEFAHN